MANTGLSIGNPALLGLGIGATDSVIPRVGLAPGASEAIRGAKATLLAGLEKPAPTMEPQASIYRSADGKQYAVGGYTFDTDDFSSAVNTEKFIGQKFEPTEGNWYQSMKEATASSLRRLRTLPCRICLAVTTTLVLLMVSSCLVVWLSLLVLRNLVVGSLPQQNDNKPN